jgi:hypothetical protein
MNADERMSRNGIQYGGANEDGKHLRISGFPEGDDKLWLDVTEAQRLAACDNWWWQQPAAESSLHGAYSWRAP